MEVEKQQAESWANQLRGMSEFEVKAASLPTTFTKVKKQMLNLIDLHEATERSFLEMVSRSAISTQAGSGHGPTRVLPSEKGSFDGAKKIVGVIAQIRETLGVVVQPLPVYSASTEQSQNSAESFSNLSALVQNSGLCTSETQIQSATTSISPLSTTYTVCLDGLTRLSHLTENRQLHSVASQLRLWAAGLFSTPFPLDVYLYPGQASTEKIRKCLMKAFAQLLVIQGLE